MDGAAADMPDNCRSSGSSTAAPSWRGLQEGIGSLSRTAETLAALLLERGGGGNQQQQQHALLPDDSGDVLQLQQQLAALAAEKQQVDADRQEMALQQGQYRGTIAQLEGALSFSERKVRDQQGMLEKLQAQVASLAAELQEARGVAALTPDRCRTATRALQAEADRATTYARSNEAQVKKLKQIVRVEARQLSELLDFAEQERLTLLDKEAALQQEVNQARERAVAAEVAAADALAAAAALQQQLDSTKAMLGASQAHALQLDEQLAEAAERAAHVGAERDAAARNLLAAEAELNDVSEYSTKMFRQVRFISHVLDKNAPLLGKLPDFAALARDLRSFVAANARHWEHRDDAKAGGGGARTASVTAGGGGGSLLTDTAVSGARDVVGKC